MDELKDLTIEQMNWEICLANLIDAIKYLREGIQMKILCKLGIHKWAEWSTHPFKANWITRQCSRCFKYQDRRLF